MILFLLLIFLPIAMSAGRYYLRGDGRGNWQTADRSSAGLLPAASANPDALIRVFAARTVRWRSIFAVHTWIVVKEKNAARYTRYDKVGWGRPVRTDGWPPDGRWFSNPPELVVAIEGEAAERLVPRVRAAVAGYPYGEWGGYRAWPGPNSNTFVAHVMREVPELSAVLPPTALGKDWHPTGSLLGWTPSRTGIELSLGGVLGVAVGWVEGIEINFLGLVAGLDLRRPALKLPGWGRIGI